MGEAPPELMEALFELAEEFGVSMTSAEQAAVARVIAATPAASATGKTVDAAFAGRGLRNPPRGFGSAVVSKWRTYGSGPSLLDILLAYRQFAIGSLSRQFGGRTRGREDELRNSLHTYLPQHGFKEAQSGRGDTDIVVPSVGSGNHPRAIIEVKVWTDRSAYEDGLEELARYIHGDKPVEAYMVVFGDRVPLPGIITESTQEIAEYRTLDALVVPVIVVPFEVDYPSKARQATRRRAKNGRD